MYASEMTVKLKSNLNVGPADIFPNYIGYVFTEW